MNIGFDAKRYYHNRSGLGNYSRDLVNGLIKQFPEDRFFLFDTAPADLNLPFNAVAAVPRSSRFLWRLFRIQQEIALYRLDVFHGLSNELPFGKWPSGVKKVVSIHDVIFREYPQHYKFADRLIYHLKTRHALRIADRIIATSQATADALLKYYKADVSRIRVVYQTCGETHRRTYSETEIENFRNSRQVPARFLLYVSSFQRRKNHLSLLLAFRDAPVSDAKLVLAGRPGETLKACETFIQENRMESRVKIICDLSDSELPLLYRAASAFVYPSLAEGFGIPLLEAAFAGLPIAANDIPVFRELAPQGSLFFNPERADRFADIMKQVLQLPKQTNTAYLEKFSREHAAQAVRGVYAEL